MVKKEGFEVFFFRNNKTWVANVGDDENLLDVMMIDYIEASDIYFMDIDLSNLQSN